ncbi:hypothetical protein DFH09DRAFT_1066901 [Mycena vulgaris]|nr:hypothetical protein DFH09DRAFT_1066901 [Mycena vulgaris]
MASSESESLLNLHECWQKNWADAEKFDYSRDRVTGNAGRTGVEILHCPNLTNSTIDGWERAGEAWDKEPDPGNCCQIIQGTQVWIECDRRRVLHSQGERCTRRRQRLGAMCRVNLRAAPRLKLPDRRNAQGFGVLSARLEGRIHREIAGTVGNLWTANQRFWGTSFEDGAVKGRSTSQWQSVEIGTAWGYFLASGHLTLRRKDEGRSEGKGIRWMGIEPKTCKRKPRISLRVRIISAHEGYNYSHRSARC